jgi:hypothetical protein
MFCYIKKPKIIQFWQYAQLYGDISSQLKCLTYRSKKLCASAPQTRYLEEE